MCELFFIISSLTDKIWYRLATPPVQSEFPHVCLFDANSKMRRATKLDSVSHGGENSSQSPVEMSKRDLAFLYKFTLLQVLFTFKYIYSTFFINKFSHRKFNSLAFFSQINLKFSKGIWFLKEARDFTRSSKNLSCALRWETRTEQYCFIYLQKDIIGQLELFS